MISIQRILEFVLAIDVKLEDETKKKWKKWNFEEYRKYGIGSKNIETTMCTNMLFYFALKVRRFCYSDRVKTIDPHTHIRKHTHMPFAQDGKIFSHTKLCIQLFYSASKVI